MIPPGSLVFNKVHLWNKGNKWRFFAGIIVNISPVRNKAFRHFMLINLIAAHLPYRGKSLQFFIAFIGYFGRVEYHPVVNM